MATSWRDKLLALLHDPPDKALSVHGHEPRAGENQRIALGNLFQSKRQAKKTVAPADVEASAIERLPMPKAGGKGERTVGPVANRLRVFHPLSAQPDDLDVPALDDLLIAAEHRELETLVAGLADDEDRGARDRFLAVWRLWPERLASGGRAFFSQLPADTRTPDHTIWNHLDMTAAFKAAEAEGRGAALLAFALGPVQSFIEASRSVRDLWTGSMILSWLSFRAMRPVIECLGPTALIYPALRGIPLVDLWLRDPEQLGGRVPISGPGPKLRLTPALPNRFLALVPWGNDGEAARELAALCREAVANAWSELAVAVKKEIQAPLDRIAPGWDGRWDSQVSGFFRTTTAVLPLAGPGEEIDRRLARLLDGREKFADAFRDAEAVRTFARAITEANDPGYDQAHAGRWQYQVELVNRSLAASRTIRHVPTNPIPSNPEERFPQKCTLLGSLEQVGPDDLKLSKDFWARVSAQDGLNVDGVRVRRGEALCTVALVKRFAGPALLAKELGVELAELRFPDTWTVAAAEWLETAEIKWKADWHDDRGRRIPWNGSWLHWPRFNHDLEEADPCPRGLFDKIKSAREKHGCPPAYYAILKLDGDDLGGWLRGTNSPKVRDVMHQDLVRYYEGLGIEEQAGLGARRPVGPALHAAISTALANFALHAVPPIVEAHHGTTIYSGGDDTLVLLSASRALACARGLRAAYMSEYYHSKGRDYLMMGREATLSGGLVVVHAKDDLRLALQAARGAEKRAKMDGRDALVIRVHRRSGEHSSALCPWSFASTVDQWTDQFRAGASDRWAYHLGAGKSTLERLPTEAIQAQIRWRISRSEDPTPRLLPPDDVADAFGAYAGSGRFGSPGKALEDFLTLCQTASFLTRGRDR